VSELSLQSLRSQSPRAGLSAESEIIELIGDLREVFENNFDRTWFSLILDGIPIDLRTVRNIRDLVTRTSIPPGDEWQLMRGIEELEAFHATVKRFLLPVLKERLGISWLLPQRRVKDPHQYVLRKFVAFTFPYNLERLHRLTLRLKARLLLYYPSLS